MITKLDPKATLMSYFSDPMRRLEGKAAFSSWNQFFKPNEEFLSMLGERFPNRLIIDCGCGVGHVTQTLRDAGFDVMPIDLYPSDFAVIDDIMGMDAAMFSYVDDMLPILCRPNRGAWIHATIIRAVEGSGTMLYIGKESHFDEDLAPLPYTVEKILTNAGENCESVWVITK